MDANTAPKGYTPWILPCKKDGKDPDTRISWKAEQSRLTPAEAIRRLKNNWGNVGLSGRADDQLILVDIDDPSIEDQLKPTLKIRSRSRAGTHAIYWADVDDEILPCNIPTDQGEIRSSDQYVVAPGSYVPCTEEGLTEKVEAGEYTEEQKQKALEDPDLGYYTLDNQKSISKITFEELPEPFKNAYRKKKEVENNPDYDFEPEIVEGKDTSALYELEITDLTASGVTGRDPHPLHASDTGANWVITEGVGHCWRHLVSLNAIQFLCVESGYMNCHEAGTPHKGSGSQVTGNDEAIWEAWKHAKETGYIPEDDPIPFRALCHITRKHELCDPEKIPNRGSDKLLPKNIYRKALQIVEDEY